MLSIKLQDIRDRRAAGEKGFTLIELLVVVVIIGILVAIAIPLYLNYRNGAKNKSVQSDIRNAIPMVEQSYSDNGSYPAAMPANVHVSDGNTLTYKLNTGTPTSYCVSGTNADTGGVWHITNSATDASSGKVATGVCP